MSESLDKMMYSFVKTGTWNGAITIGTPRSLCGCDLAPAETRTMMDTARISDLLRVVIRS